MEVAVLVGDFASFDDPRGQKMLAKVKALRPEALTGNSGKSQSFSDFRKMIGLDDSDEEDHPRARGPSTALRCNGLWLAEASHTLASLRRKRVAKADILEQKQVLPSNRKSLASKQAQQAATPADNPVTRSEAMRILEAANRAEAERQAELQAAREDTVSAAGEGSVHSPLRPFVR